MSLEILRLIFISFWGVIPSSSQGFIIWFLLRNHSQCDSEEHYRGSYEGSPEELGIQFLLALIQVKRITPGSLFKFSNFSCGKINLKNNPILYFPTILNVLDIFLLSFLYVWSLHKIADKESEIY